MIKKSMNNKGQSENEYGIFEKKRSIALQILVVSGVFSVIVAVLLLLNFIQLEFSDPLDSSAMEQLVSRLADDPDNDALKNDIRNLDLLARKAYFTSEWQINTGAWLLLAGAVLFIGALRFYTDLNKKIKKPDNSGTGEVLSRLISQKWILISGITIVVLALAGSYFSTDYLKKYDVSQKVSPVPVPEKDSSVEVISLVPVDSSSVQSQPVREQGNTEISETKTEVQKTIPEIMTPVAEKAAKAVSCSPEKIKKMHNSFRGAFGLGLSEAKGIPVDWDGSSGKNVLWKVTVPKPGYNSPVIWENKIFVSGGDANERIVFCYDRNSGKLLWQGRADNIEGSPSVPPKTSDDTGLSAPGLAVDANGVFAIFATGDIIAFSLDGIRLWAENLGVPQNHYGHSSSLLVYEGKVIVQYDTQKGGRMLALSVLDGSVIWDIKRDNKISWSSPVLIEREGKPEIVTSSDPYVAGYDPDDGHLIWKIDCMTGEVAPSPGYGSGLVFAGNEYATLAAIKPGADPEIVWEDSEYLPEVSSPVAYNGLLFVATSYGVLVCYNALTGEKQWEKEFSSGFYSSPVVADGKLYIIDISGIMHILLAGKEGTVVSEPPLGEKAFATPAFMDGRIYIRGINNLFCIGK